MEGSSPGTSTESSMAVWSPWFQGSSLQNQERIHFCCLKPCVWCIDRTAWGNYLITPSYHFLPLWLLSLFILHVPLWLLFSFSSCLFETAFPYGSHAGPLWLSLYGLFSLQSLLSSPMPPSALLIHLSLPRLKWPPTVQDFSCPQTWQRASWHPE